MMQTSYRPHWIREDFVDYVLGQVNPMWTWQRVMARVEAIEPIADDMIKLTLSANKPCTDSSRSICHVDRAH